MRRRRQRKKVLNLKSQHPKVISRNYSKPPHFRDGSNIPSPWTMEVIQFSTGHGPFLCFLKMFNLYHTNRCACGEVDDPLHFTTSCPLTVSFHMTKPSDHLTKHWGKSRLSNKHSRSKIIQLVNFLTDREVLFKLDPRIDSNFSYSDSDIEVVTPALTRHSQ
ncbi:hypothetical protein AVEN_4446-1 [Araneus ventricosus]|uniref:Uncharacterized protein n=1 Tax=Araneus ventricosus TaxID=182803 RepID=A0A4Y2GWD3_ARAVE|nr:hypothetical protein AVEN_4446-1 [Araneus ventricosus]